MLLLPSPVPGPAGINVAQSRTSDPDTSRAAADSIEAEVLTVREVNVLSTLKRLGGRATAEELVEASGLPWNSLTPRLRPLATKGAIRDSGERRIARSGRRQIVWEAVERK